MHELLANKKFVLCWIPSYIGIQRNEKVDLLAKNNSIGNKLLEIKPTISEHQSVVRNIRKEEVVLARIRLGHTRVTYSYLLLGVDQPQCVGCDAPLLYVTSFWSVAISHRKEIDVSVLIT